MSMVGFWSANSPLRPSESAWCCISASSDLRWKGTLTTTVSLRNFRASFNARADWLWKMPWYQWGRTNSAMTTDR